MKPRRVDVRDSAAHRRVAVKGCIGTTGLLTAADRSLGDETTPPGTRPRSTYQCLPEVFDQGCDMRGRRFAGRSDEMQRERRRRPVRSRRFTGEARCPGMALKCSHRQAPGERLGGRTRTG